MDVHPYYGPGNVIIDSCTTCDLVWLDIGELKQIAEAPGGDRGVRKPPIPREPPPLSPREASAAAAQTDVLGLLFDLLT
jgi:Zn-finger nucleic acid-binding protein